jgi:murein L,D-transpeptidase YcbB/YkuD
VPLVPELERDVPIVEPSGAEAHGAAEALRSFLVATKRFGNKKDRPKEISDAQSAMGLKPDGIVGPATRAAATKLGVKLPTR